MYIYIYIKYILYKDIDTDLDQNKKTTSNKIKSFRSHHSKLPT